MTDDDHTAPAEQQVSFEAALERLDRIVARLEGGEVGLEEALRLFEEGQRHAAQCRERLAAAKQRIDEITGPASTAGGGDGSPGNGSSAPEDEAGELGEPGAP